MVQTTHSPSARWASHLLRQWLLRRLLCGKCCCLHEGATSVFVGFDCVVAVPMLEHVALGAGLLTSSAPMPPPKGPQVQVGTHLPLQLLLPLQLHLGPHALMARPKASFPADLCKQELVLLYCLQKFWHQWLTEAHLKISTGSWIRRLMQPAVCTSVKFSRPCDTAALNTTVTGDYIQE